jgi:aspartate aminotransferase-like enzyme
VRKIRLLTPGPTPVPERIALAMAQPILHHRAPEFEAVFARCREGLRWIFQTRHDVLTFSSSGTGAMEGAVVNFLRRGEKALVVDAGKFGERWWKILRAYGVEPVVLKVEWGRAVDPDEVRRALDREPSARAVFLQANESATGVAHPVREVAEVTRGREVLCVVDAVSALGAMDLPFDAWGIDIMVSGSQKALMLPPGLAFAAASEKAWRFNGAADLPRFYFDWKRERDAQKKDQTAFTPAISLMLGLDESFRMLREEGGLEAVFARHARLARAARAGAQAMGLQLYAERPSNAMTVVRAPDGVDSEQLVDWLFQNEGLKLVGGQDQAKGKIFRIAHLGYFDGYDIVTVIAGVEKGLRALGWRCEPGRGTAAAVAALEEKA